MTRVRIRAASVAIIAVAALAAGCGGGGKSDTVSPEDWANNLCSAFVDWSSSVRSAAGSLRGNASESALKSSAKDIKEATDKLRTDLRDVGTPDTDAGGKAKDAVDKLANQLKTDVDEINDAVQGVSGTKGVVQAASSISATLVTVGDQVQAAFQNFQQIDAKGELEDAFRNADSCKKLGKQGS